MLNTDFERGGTPTVIYELATRLRQRGHDVSAACLASLGPVGSLMRASGVPVHALGARSAFDLGVFGRLSELLGGGFDCVFSFLVHANVVAAWNARRRPQVRWLQSIQTTQPRPRWHWLAQRWAARHADTIVVPSQSVADCAAARAGVPVSRIAIIPNGVEVRRFSGVKRSPPRAAVVGFLGRLDPVKRVPDLIDAAALLDAAVRVDIYGDGEQRDHLQRLLERKGMEGRVVLRGASPSPEAALAQIDVLALCSAAEGMPMVLLEAMAAGIPIVATDVPGIRDVVRHEETALLCPARDPVALAAALRRMLIDSQLRERLVASAHAHVCGQFSWDRIIPRYEALLFEDSLRTRGTVNQS
jgi:glycosyltransferase involved in cell wall biosynthesis